MTVRPKRSYPALLCLFLATSLGSAQPTKADDEAIPGYTMTIAGPEQLVLSHKDMTCGPRGGMQDRTDMPVSAFRRKDGSVLLLAGNQFNYFLEGPSVEAAKRTTCESLLPPINDPDPKQFNARRWFQQVYAVDYDTVLGFVHIEYHGDDFFSDGCKRSSRRDFECWYASAGLLISRDGGFTFETPPPPDNVLAAPPVKFEVGKKRIGAYGPRVVRNPNDGFVYVFISNLDLNRNLTTSAQCLLRGSGKRLDDWRAWDGQGFNIDMRSPYLVPRGPDCTPVLDRRVHTVRYVPSLKIFVATSFRGPRLVYLFSKDLMKWSAPKTLMEVQRKQSRKKGDPPARDFFSLLDPNSSSINFDTLEKTPYLYFVEYTEDRRKVDLYRVPITIK
jgi:hypothetical protein